MKEEKTLLQKIGEIQREIGAIEKTKENPFFKSSYFDINGLLEVLMPHLKKHNIVISQPISTITGSNVHTVLKTIVSDGNETMESEFPLPTIQDPQKMGSAITYYRRYSLQSLFCLQAKDDDGNQASKETKANKKADTTDDLKL